MSTPEMRVPLGDSDRPFVRRIYEPGSHPDEALTLFTQTFGAAPGQFALAGWELVSVDLRLQILGTHPLDALPTVTLTNWGISGSFNQMRDPARLSADGVEQSWPAIRVEAFARGPQRGCAAASIAHPGPRLGQVELVLVGAITVRAGSRQPEQR